MPDSFDPYHKWLGISPKDQPPDQYRLLGVDRFESDADVISSAADQRMIHVRTFQTGKHSELSQRMLNELSTARVCLLSPQKRAAYDAYLRAVDDTGDADLAADGKALVLPESPEPESRPVDWGDRVEVYAQFIKSSDASLASLWAAPDLIQVCPECDRFLFPILGTGNRYWCSECEVQVGGVAHDASLEEVAVSTQACPECKERALPILGTGNCYWCPQCEVQTAGEPHNSSLEEATRSQPLFDRSEDNGLDTPDNQARPPMPGLTGLDLPVAKPAFQEYVPVTEPEAEQPSAADSSRPKASMDYEARPPMPGPTAIDTPAPGAEPDTALDSGTWIDVNPPLESGPRSGEASAAKVVAWSVFFVAIAAFLVLIASHALSGKTNENGFAKGGSADPDGAKKAPRPIEMPVPEPEPKRPPATPPTIPPERLPPRRIPLPTLPPRRQPTPPAPRPSLTADEWMVGANNAFDREEWDAVIAYCNKVIELAPQQKEAYHRRGEAHYRREEWDAMADDFTVLVRLDPKSPDAYSRRAYAHDKSGNREQAIADYKQALRLDPHWSPARIGLKKLEQP